MDLFKKENIEETVHKYPSFPIWFDNRIIHILLTKYSLDFSKLNDKFFHNVSIALGNIEICCVPPRFYQSKLIEIAQFFIDHSNIVTLQQLNIWQLDREDKIQIGLNIAEEMFSCMQRRGAFNKEYGRKKDAFDKKLDKLEETEA